MSEYSVGEKLRYYEGYIYDKGVFTSGKEYEITHVSVSTKTVMVTTNVKKRTRLMPYALIEKHFRRSSDFSEQDFFIYKISGKLPEKNNNE